jgi:dTMP kinase
MLSIEDGDGLLLVEAPAPSARALAPARSWCAPAVPAIYTATVPCFVTLEGIEGCGKTTQAGLLADFVRASYGLEVVLTREPGGTESTRPIRALLADPDSKLDPRAELLLFLADRSQHVATVIRPSLDAGAFVICDRFSDSTLAYQGYGRGHPLDLLERLNAWASREIVPELTLWIDCDVTTGLRRATKRTGGPGDRFESEPLDFHARVRDGFADLHRNFPDRIVRIDGNASVEEVFGRIRQEIETRLGRKLEAAAPPAMRSATARTSPSGLPDHGRSRGGGSR